MIFFCFLSSLDFIYFCCDLYYFLPYGNFGLRLFFSKSLRCKVRLFIWDISFSSMYAFITISFPLGNVLTASYKFWYLCFHFHLSQNTFLNSLLISSLTQECTVWFPLLLNISVFLLLFISTFIPLCLENILDVISVFLNLLRLALWPNI